MSFDTPESIAQSKYIAALSSTQEAPSIARTVQTELTGPAELTAESILESSPAQNPPELTTRTAQLSDAAKAFAKETYGAPTLLERFTEALQRLPEHLGNLFRANLFPVNRTPPEGLSKKESPRARETKNEAQAVHETLAEALEHSVEKTIDTVVDNVGIIQVMAAMWAQRPAGAEASRPGGISATELRTLKTKIDEAQEGAKLLTALSDAQAMIQSGEIQGEKLPQALKTLGQKIQNIQSQEALPQDLEQLKQDLQGALEETIEALEKTDAADAHVIGVIKKNFSERLIGGIATAFQHILQTLDWVLTSVSRLQIPVLSQVCLILSGFVKACSLVAGTSSAKWGWEEMGEAWKLSSETVERVEKGSEKRIEDPVLRAIMKGVLQKIDPKVATTDFLFSLAGIALTAAGCAVLLGNLLVWGGVLAGTALAVINPIGGVLGGALLLGLVAWGTFKGIRSLYKMISNWNNEYALMDATRCLDQLKKQQTDPSVSDYQPTSKQYKKLLSDCLTDAAHPVWSKSFSNTAMRAAIRDKVFAEGQNENLSAEELYNRLDTSEKIAFNEAIQNWTLRKSAKSSHDVATDLMMHLMKEGSPEEKERIRYLLVEDIKVLDNATVDAIANVSEDNKEHAKNILQAALGVKQSIMYGHGREALGLSDKPPIAVPVA